LCPTCLRPCWQQAALVLGPPITCCLLQPGLSRVHAKKLHPVGTLVLAEVRMIPRALERELHPGYSRFFVRIQKGSHKTQKKQTATFSSNVSFLLIFPKCSEHLLPGFRMVYHMSLIIGPSVLHPLPCELGRGNLQSHPKLLLLCPLITLCLVALSCLGLRKNPWLAALQVSQT
jgi:hypothetical protein